MIASCDSNANNGSLSLTVKYDSSKNEAKIIEQERDIFLKLLQSIDDNIFVEICEEVGSELLNKIQKAINGDKLETVRSAILRFKQEAKKVINSKIKLYNECLLKLNK